MWEQCKAHSAHPYDICLDIAPAPGPGSCQIFVKMHRAKMATFQINILEDVFRIKDMSGAGT